MIALMRRDDFVTVKDRFRAEKFQMTLGERDSTAVITIGPEAPEIIIGDILKDETEPGAGIFWRVSRVDTDYNTETRTVNCNHAISLLKEKLLFGEQTTATICGRAGATSCTAKEAMRYVMSFQRDFELGDFPGGYEGVSNAYSFNGDTVFDAMETISATLEDCWWEYDFRSYPFRLHLRDRRQANIETELRLSRNIQNAKLSVDRSSLFTRLFPIGKNDLQLPEKYVSRNEQLYGMVCKTMTEATKETAEALREWANTQLKYGAEPAVTVTVSAMDLSQQTGEPLDHIMLGSICRMPLPGYSTTIIERINRMAWSDKIKDPNSITVTLANTRETATSIVSSAIKNSKKSSRTSTTNTVKGVFDIDLTTDNKDKNKYILWRQDYKGVWKDVGTFSRAVASWSVQATGGTLKVTANPQNQSKEISLQSGTGKWSGNNYTGPIQYSEDGGKTWKDSGATFKADGKPRYNAGWTAARNSVRDKTYTYNGRVYSYFPTSSVAAANRLNWIYVAQPSATVDGGIDDNNRFRYYVTNTKNTAYIRYGGLNGYVVAQNEHGAYNDGWRAARNAMRDKTYTYGGKDYEYFPTTGVPLADRLTWIYVAQPSATVDGGIDDNNRYRYYVTNTKNIAYLRYGGVNGSVVAQNEHGAYNDGWLAARDSMRGKTYTYDGVEYDYFPTSGVSLADRLNWIYVAQPSETVDGGINDNNRFRYYVTNTKNIAYLRYGGVNGSVVAQTEHGAYDNGWLAARSSVRGKSYTYDGKTYYYNPTQSVALADRQPWMGVAVPSETVDGGINDHNTYWYYLTASNGKAYIRYGGYNGYIVAEESYSYGDASNIQLYAGGSGEIVRTKTQPSGTTAVTALATVLKQAYDDMGGIGQWVTFPATISGGTGTKRFSVNMG